MKWCTIVLFTLLLPAFLFAQNGAENLQVASYASQKTGGASSVSFSGMGSKNKMSFELLPDAADHFYLKMQGAGWGAFTIDSGNKLVLVLSNDSSVKLRATSLQSFEPDLAQNTYSHTYNITPNDLKALSRYELRMVRKYSFTSYFDLEIPRENAKRLQKLSGAFLAGLEKPQPVEKMPAQVVTAPKQNAGLQQIALKNIRNHIGDSVEFCSKIFRTRYFEGSEDGPTVLDVQADFADPYVNVVILEKDRLNFSSAPEKRYLNKDVCISGVVDMRNNLPYLVVRSSQQVKLKSAVSLAEAELFEGDTITVSGPLFAAINPKEAGEDFTLFHLGAPTENTPMTLLVKNDDRKNFTVSPETYFAKNIRVTGKVIRYRNKPQIVLQQTSQLELLPNQDSAPVYAVQEAPKKDTPVQQQPIVQTVETEPETGVVKPGADALVGKAAIFPGGPDALAAFLKQNLVLPKELKAGEEKQVVVSFRIDATGGCRDIRVLESGGSAFDKEAKKVLLKMPRWTPAFFNGSFFESKITHTITFKREEAGAPL